MCTIVHHSPRPILRSWNYVDVEPHQIIVITIPIGLSYERQVLAVRAVLAEIGIPQPDHEAVCWCGELVESFRVPAQRHTSEGAYVAS